MEKIRIIKFQDFNLNEGSLNDPLESLKKKYPNAIITMSPYEKFPGSYFARVDVIKQNGEKEYLGALKGPVSKRQALDFYSNVLKKNYDKFY
jgi:hypothetical protein